MARGTSRPSRRVAIASWRLSLRVPTKRNAGQQAGALPTRSAGTDTGAPPAVAQDSGSPAADVRRRLPVWVAMGAGIPMVLLVATPFLVDRLATDAAPSPPAPQRYEIPLPPTEDQAVAYPPIPRLSPDGRTLLVWLRGVNGIWKHTFADGQGALTAAGFSSLSSTSTQNAAGCFSPGSTRRCLRMGTSAIPTRRSRERRRGHGRRYFPTHP